MGNCASNNGKVSLVSNGVSYTCNAYDFGGSSYALIGASLETLQYQVNGATE